MTTGRFICLEGIDHSGKTTQAKALVDNLNVLGLNAVYLAFPDRTTATGRMVNEVLSGSRTDLNPQCLHLLFCANRWEKSRFIKSEMAQGRVVVVDRYSFSGAAYSCAENVPGRDVDWCLAPERGLPMPDVVVQLVLSPEKAMGRHQAGVAKEKYEEVAFLTAVEASYRAVRQQAVQQFLKCGEPGWVCVDADAPFPVVHQSIMAAVDPFLPRIIS